MSNHTTNNLPLPLKIKQDLLQFLVSQEPTLNKEGMTWKIEFDLSKRDLKLARYNLMLLEIFENSKWDSMPPGLKEIQEFRNLINNLQVDKGDANSNNQVQWSNFSEEAIEESEDTDMIYQTSTDDSEDLEEELLLLSPEEKYELINNLKKSQL